MIIANYLGKRLIVGRKKNNTIVLFTECKRPNGYLKDSANNTLTDSNNNKLVIME